MSFTKARLENDDGVRQYDLEFWKDGVEYSAELRASDGAVLSWDVDREHSPANSQNVTEGDIGLERAKEIALDKAGLAASDVTFTEASYEVDDGLRVYEIEFRQGMVEYSAKIGASDGAILSWEIDRD